MSDARSLMDEFDYVWNLQSNFRNLWDECARYVMPGWDSFISDRTPGEKRSQFLFDSTAVSANERFAAAIQQMITPATQQYQKIAPLSQAMRDNKNVDEHFDEVTKILFAARYRAKAAFSSNADECYMSLGLTGNMCMFIDDDPGVGIRYRSIPMSEVCWAVDHVGQVDVVYRMFKLTARAAIQKFGDKAPPSCVKAMEKVPNEEFSFLHCVKPNKDRKAGMPGYKGMRFESWYVACKEKSVISRSGYRSFPYAIGRYRMAPREVYGRGPAQASLPAIRTINEQKKDLLRQGQMQVAPGWLLQEEGTLTPFSMRPDALNYGMLNSDGKPLAVPLTHGGNIPIGIELMSMEAQAINDAFLTSLFQILVQNPQMTATEALIRLQEKGMMIAPAGMRLQGEWLGTCTERELDILAEAGQLPSPPREMIEDGGGYKIDYLSPLNRALRAEEGTAIMNTVQSIGVMAQLQPSVVAAFDWDGAARDLAEINGFPTKHILSQEDVEAIREDQAQQAQQQQILEAAPGLSQSALNLAKAQQATA